MPSRSWWAHAVRPRRLTRCAGLGRSFNRGGRLEGREGVDVGRRNGLMTMLAAVAAVVLLAGGCGGGGGGGGGSNESLTSRGPITYVQGKDNSDVVRPMLERWNAAHPNEKVTFKEQSESADAQHDDLVQHFQAKDPNYAL